MSSVLDQVRRTIERYDLLSPGETVVVGVSGGPDSLCLLHCLCLLRAEYELQPHVAHLHHGLRGAEADADAEFVRALASEWNLPCAIEQADVLALAQRHRLALEEAARRARYAFLRRAALASGAQTIAVGHNADDQAETVLMHWLRGSGLAGLRGMLPTTSLEEYRLFEVRDRQAATHGLALIRPLLEVTRAEIEAYCDRHGLEPRFDRSNLDTTYFRNWLRHEVLPLLARHNPRVQDVIRRSALVISDDYALLRSLLEETWPSVVLEEATPPLMWDGRPPSRLTAGRAEADGTSQAERYIVFDLLAWRALPTSLQRATLREAIHRLRRSLRNINFLHVENALLVARDGTTGDQATLPRGLMLTVAYDRFMIADTAAVEPLPDWPLLPDDAAPLSVSLPGDTWLPGAGWILRTEVLARQGLPTGWQANADPWQAFLDAGAVGEHLVLRTRRPGDRFQPQGLGGHTAKLADFYTNQKVPRTVRSRLPLLVAAERPVDAGRIVWVCGWRVDERACITERTDRVLLVHFVQG